MDRAGADFFDVCRQIEEVLGANPVPLVVPIGAEETFRGIVDLLKIEQSFGMKKIKGMTFDVIPIPEDLVDTVEEYREKLVEAVAEYDEALMEKYFEDPDSITADEMRAAIRAATCDMSIIPMMCGSAFKNKGVQHMLDGVCAFLPSPVDVEAIVGINPDTEEEEERKPDPSEPFSALAFKITTDPFVGRLAYFRVYSGTLDAGSYI